MTAMANATQALPHISQQNATVRSKAPRRRPTTRLTGAKHVAGYPDIHIKDRQPLPPEVDGMQPRLRAMMAMTMGYFDWAADETRLDAYY